MKKLDDVEYIALLLVVIAIALTVLYWESVEHFTEHAIKEITGTQSVASAPAMPIKPVRPAASQASASAQLQLPAESASLPRLDHSDAAIGNAIEATIGNRAFAQWLVPDKLILHIVATLDNLPRQQAPVQAWPVKPAPGMFLVVGAGPTLQIAASNAARYVPYMRLLQRIKVERLVSVYLDFYPLFERAYKELGYPKGDFNARLLVVIDNLLGAPEPAPPVRLAQPHVVYTYADATLESASAGQKILMRLGLRQEQEVKSKLRQIKAELLRHMRGGTTPPAVTQ
jgi:hypothetical protein